MKFHLKKTTRRALSLTLALCLAVFLASFAPFLRAGNAALAEPPRSPEPVISSASSEPQEQPAVPPAASEPQEQPAVPPAASEPQEQPAVPPASSEPQEQPAVPPASSEPQEQPAVPPAASVPQEQPAVPPAASVPQGKPANGITTSQAMSVSLENGVLTIPYRGIHTKDDIVKALHDAGENFYDLTTLKITSPVSSSGTSIYFGELVGLYTDSSRPGPVLDLSEFTTMTNIDNSGPKSYVQSVILPSSLERIWQNAFSPTYAPNLIKVDLGNCEKITSIEAGTFPYGTNISTIILPSTLETIGKKAFTNCRKLKELTIPATVTSIGDFAFQFLDKLTSITFEEDSANPLTPLVIGKQAFQNTGLKSLALPDRLVSIGDSAFNFSQYLTSLSFGGGNSQLTTIGNEAFSKNFKLPSVDLSGCANLQSIGNKAFGECDELVSVDLSGCTGLQTIGDSAFWKNHLLTSAKLNDCTSLQSIGNNAFRECDKLRSVDLSGCAGLETIGDSAFYSCGALAGIAIPPSVTYIGDQTFYKCSNLASVDFTDFANSQLTTVELEAFSRCDALTTIAFPPLMNDFKNGSTFSKCEKLQTVDLSACTALKTIPNSFCHECKNLTTVKLPTSLTTIKPYAFCPLSPGPPSAVPTLTVNLSACENLVTIENNAFEGSGITECVLANSALESIGESAFAKCKKLPNVDLSNCASLNTIKRDAFQNCTLLKTVTLEGCASLQSIGQGAFASPLETLNLSGCKALESIGQVAFGNRDDLTTLNLSGCEKLPSLMYAFDIRSTPAPLTDVDLSGCKALESLTILNGTLFDHCPNLVNVNLSGCTALTTVGTVFQGKLHLTTVDLSGSGVASLADNAFAGCTALETLKLPAKLNTIGNSTFKSCTTLEGIAFGPDPSANGPAGMDTGSTGLTSMGTSAFEGCTSLKSVSLGEGLGSIPDSTFKNCGALESITLPDSVTAIGVNAFQSSGLTSVKLPADVISIGTRAFYTCNSLAKIDASGCTGLNSIGTYAFWGCTALTDVNFSNTALGSLDSGTFTNCPLKTVNLSNCQHLTDIHTAFQGKTTLATVNLSDCIKLESIGAGAFQDCKALTTVNLSGCIKLESIGASAFQKCTALKKIDLTGSGLSTIGVSAFQNCKVLPNIKLPAGVTSIGERAFQDCDVFTSIDASGCTGLSSIGDEAFKGCNALTDVNFSNTALTSLDSSTFTGCPLETVNLSNCQSLTDIHTAFQGKAALATVNLSGCSTLKNIGAGAFQNCTALTTINLSGCSILKTIEVSAFQNCKLLPKITLPAGVTSIGGNAFQDCITFTSINASGCTNLNSIGANAFGGCNALKDVNFSNTALTFLDSSTFTGCPLETVNLSNCQHLTDIHTAFQGKAALTTVNLSGCMKLERIANDAFNGCSELRYFASAANGLRSAPSPFALPGNVTSIGVRAFQGCTALKKIDLPAEMKTIEESAFQGSGLEHIDLPAKLTEVQTSSFQGCTSLETVAFEPESDVTKIGKSAFQGCTGLGGISIPTKVADIDESAFKGCEKLTNLTFEGVDPLRYGEGYIVFPERPLTIGVDAFRGCTKLPDLIFPEKDDVVVIKAGAFMDCDDVKNVYFQSATPPTLQDASGHPATIDQVFPVTGDSANTPSPNAVLLYYPTGNTKYTSQSWIGGTDINTRMVNYDHRKANAKLTGLKSGQDGNPPTYAVWETPRFSMDITSAPNGEKSDFKNSGANDWALYPVSLYTSSTTPSAVATGTFSQNGTVYSASIPPPHPVGVFRLKVGSPVDINVGEGWGGNGISTFDEAGSDTSWRKFPLFGSDFDRIIEFLPPPVPAEASYLLTVINGTGGGYYSPDDSAPIAAKLEATPPQPDAKFLRWELVSGTGTFADANSPETRFTMAVGDSTVRAVFDKGPYPPLPPPHPTPTPHTGDPGGAAPLTAAASLLLSAAAMAALARHKRKQAGK